MHFLCLHGKGTNSQILEFQLSAIRYQLGDSHSYEFVEGNIPEKIDPVTAANLSIGSEETFGFFDETSPDSCLKALNDLYRYIEIRGPFDGLIAFSQGTVLAATLLVGQALRGGGKFPIKIAIFFSGNRPADPNLLEGGVISQLNPELVGEVINIPTVHVWGRVDKGELEFPPDLLRLCRKEVRETYEHEGGHEIPGTKDKEAVAVIVQKMRRAIWRAENTHAVLN